CILRAGRAVPARRTFVRQGRNLEVPCAGMAKVRDRGDGGSGPNDPLRVPEYCLDSPSRPSLRSTNWRHKRRRRPVRWALPASTSGGSMHFIEQLFGSAPDGGNGAFESLLLIFPFLIALWKMKRKPVFGWLG